MQSASCWRSHCPARGQQLGRARISSGWTLLHFHFFLVARLKYGRRCRPPQRHLSGEMEPEVRMRAADVPMRALAHQLPSCMEEGPTWTLSSTFSSSIVRFFLWKCREMRRKLPEGIDRQAQTAVVRLFILASIGSIDVDSGGPKKGQN